MSLQEQQAALGIDKFFWMITEAKYDKLRKVEGCDTLTDLNATVTDA